MSHPSRPRIALIVATALAVLAIIASFGSALPFLPFSPIVLSGPSAASSEGGTTAVVIDHARRVALIDDASRLEAIINLETLEAPIEIATDVCVSNGHVFVSGLRREPDSDIIAMERIASFDLDGNLEGIVYEHEGADGQTIPRILSLDDKPGIVLFSLVEQEGGKARVGLRSTEDGGRAELASQQLAIDQVVEACYAPDPDRIVTLSYRGILDDTNTNESAAEQGARYTSISVAWDGTLYACDNITGSIYRVNQDRSATPLPTDMPYDRVRVQDDVICALGRDSDVVRIMDRDGNLIAQYDSVEPTIEVSARVLLVWVGAAYLVVLVLSLAVRASLRLVRAGRANELAVPAASFAVVATVALALGNTSLASFRAQVATRTNEINAYADYLESIAPQLSQGLSSLEDRELFFKTAADVAGFEEGERALHEVASLASASTDNGIGMYVALYGQDDKGIYSIVHTLNEYVWGETVSGASNLPDIESAFERRDSSIEAQVGTSRYEATLYRTVYVPSTKEGGRGIVIEVGSRMQSFTSSIISRLAQNALGLLVLALVIYLGYTELRACGRCVVRYRRMQQDDEDGAISALARPFALTSMMLTGVDAVMSTLIAKDLLAAAGMGASSPLVAVPAVMLGVGQVLGEGVYGRLGSRVPLRRMMARGGAAMLACAILAALAVVSGSFWAYCAAKLLLAVPFGLLYTAAYSLGRHSVTAEQRELANKGVNRSNTSSAALGTALGGYAAHYLGNAWVYVAIAFVSLALVMMAVQLIPVGTLPPERDRDFSPEERGRIRAFVRSPNALAIALCLILPSAVVTGYASFLFPLFSSEMGFAKSDINNMYLIGQLIVFVSIAGIDRLRERLGNWAAGLYAIAGLGIVFCTFSLNVTVVWGVVAIALVALLVKIANAWKRLWTTEAAKAHVPLGWATGAMFIVNSLSRVAKPFILSALVVSGQHAVIIIGLFCLACATVFWLVTRKSMR